MTEPAGDDDIGSIYRATIDGLYAFVARRCDGDRDLAEDVTQEAWLRAVRAWNVSGIPASPQAWLTTVARNLLANHFRRAPMEAMTDHFSGPDVQSGAGERQSLVQRGLARRLIFLRRNSGHILNGKSPVRGGVRRAWELRVSCNAVVAFGRSQLSRSASRSARSATSHRRKFATAAGATRCSRLPEPISRYRRYARLSRANASTRCYARNAPARQAARTPWRRSWSCMPCKRSSPANN